MKARSILVAGSWYLSAIVVGQVVNSDITSKVKGSIIDLGYSQYQGYVDNTSGLEFFLGVRYAAPPGRWQAPTKPAVNRTAVIEANTYSTQCYQSDIGALGTLQAAHDYTGSEDCLFLNVWRPANSTGNLPVLFWIHGGGYGIMNAQNDPTFLMQITNSKFVFVSIEYRLGAFGFLSSSEVKAKGALNAGLLDQNLALQWVQEHISLFGGNANQVTIFGESAGAGSVMQHLLSYGGNIGTTLFTNAIMASPYLPKQYKYDDAVPTKYYNQFAAAAGCSYTTGNYDDLFGCLSLKSPDVLANASQAVSSSAFPGTWAFTPVTDGVFAKYPPSQQLLTGKLNGRSVLVGNNDHEGNIFVPQNITSSEGFLRFVGRYLPNLRAAEMSKLLRYYPEPALSGGLYSSQYERAALFVGDSTFVCPGSWIADAYTSAYRYTYAVPAAYHGLDLPNYLPSIARGQAFPSTLNNLSKALDTCLISFIETGVPSLDSASSGQTFPLWSSPTYGAQALFNVSNAQTISFNYVGYPINLTIGGTPNVTINSGLQLINGLDRCDYWRSVAPLVPI